MHTERARLLCSGRPLRLHVQLEHRQVHLHSLAGRCFQYRGTDGSTSVDQASMPPVTL